MASRSAASSDQTPGDKSLKSGKIWGTTESLFSNKNVEFHRIEIKKNGYCSKHKHEHKWNMFFVESGELEVITWSGLRDSTVLQAGNKTLVPPGVQHQFKALTDVIAYEIYWVDLDTSDIIRETVGGIG